MNKEELNKKLSKFYSDEDRYDSVEITIELKEREAFAYRLAHLLWKHSLENYNETDVNKDLFLIGLDKIDKGAREQISQSKDNRA